VNEARATASNSKCFNATFRPDHLGLATNNQVLGSALKIPCPTLVAHRSMKQCQCLQIVLLPPAITNAMNRWLQQSWHYKKWPLEFGKVLRISVHNANNTQVLDVKSIPLCLCCTGQQNRCLTFADGPTRTLHLPKPLLALHSASQPSHSLWTTRRKNRISCWNP
jgi:hypothetical protein